MTGSLDSYLTFELSSIVLCSVFNQVSVWRLNHLIFSVAMSDHFSDVFITHKPHAAILDVEFRVWKLWLKSYSITTCTECQKSSRTTTTSHRMWEWEPDCHWLCFLIIQAHSLSDSQPFHPYFCQNKASTFLYLLHVSVFLLNIITRVTFRRTYRMHILTLTTKKIWEYAGKYNAVS